MRTFKRCISLFLLGFAVGLIGIEVHRRMEFHLPALTVPSAEAAPSLLIQRIATSNVAARSTNLGAGFPILLQCDTATWIKFGDSTVTAVASTDGFLISASQGWTDATSQGRTFVSLILTAGTGNCNIFYDP